MVGHENDKRTNLDRTSSPMLVDPDKIPGGQHETCGIARRCVADLDGRTFICKVEYMFVSAQETHEAEAEISKKSSRLARQYLRADEDKAESPLAKMKTRRLMQAAVDLSPA